MLVHNFSGGNTMSRTVNAGARLDRLPLSSFHRRIFFLIGAGMFFDGYDLYVGTTVLGSTLQSGFSTLNQNAWFVSLTFLGMTLGSLITGFLGDRYGRRFTYQVNLLIFGIASLAAAFAPSMDTLNLLRLVMGLGLGAEIVVGYSTLTEFVPPRLRGRMLASMALLVVSGLPATALIGTLVISTFGWRPMFVVAGIGALIVWYLRKALPESPRWLEAQGRTEEAEALMQSIEREAAAAGPLPAPAPRRADRRVQPRLADQAADPAAHDRRLRGADLDQHPDLRLRDLAADLLRATRAHGRAFVRLYAGDHPGFAGGLPDRRVRRRLFRTQALDHRRLGSDHRVRRHLSVRVHPGAAAHGRVPVDRRHLHPGRHPVRRLHPGAVSDRNPAARQRHLQHLRAGRDDRHALHRRHAVQGIRRRRRAGADDRAARRADRDRLRLGRRAQPAPARGDGGGRRGADRRRAAPGDRVIHQAGASTRSRANACAGR